MDPNPDPPVLGGGAYSLTREGLDWESPNSDEETYTVVFFIHIRTLCSGLF
jgi:hypothetical protein